MENMSFLDGHAVQFVIIYAKTSAAILVLNQVNWQAQALWVSLIRSDLEHLAPDGSSLDQVCRWVVLLRPFSQPEKSHGWQHCSGPDLHPCCWKRPCNSWVTEPSPAPGFLRAWATFPSYTEWNIPTKNWQLYRLRFMYCTRNSLCLSNWFRLLLCCTSLYTLFVGSWSWQLAEGGCVFNALSSLVLSFST